MGRQIPEIPTGNFFGHFRSYVSDPLAFLRTHQKQFGDMFTFRVAQRRLIFINHPDYIKRVLQDNHRNYRKSAAYRKLALLLGDGLFTSDGEYWLTQRRIIQPAFHRDQIKTYAETMHELCMQMVDRWNEHKEIELTTEMTDLTLRIISKTMLDIDLADQGSVVKHRLPFALSFMVNRITSPLAVPLWLPTTQNHRFRKALKMLDEVINGIIRHKKGNLGLDLLSQLILLKDESTGKGMSDQQLRDELMTIFLAGHETTAMGLTWLLNHILQDEDLRQQLVDVAQNFRYPWDATTDFFIQNVINEGLRLFAPVWILSREAIGGDQLGAYDIHSGDRIIFSPYLVHRHTDFWVDPDKFDATRFGDDIPHRYAYYPFGGGPRICVGQHFALMEMTVILVNILRHFPTMQLKSTEPIGYDYSITLRPDRPIRVTLR
jgi:cytochrome P450